MTTKEDVCALHEQNPSWTSTELAKALGCSSAYVRATAGRNGLILKGHNERTPEQLRESAAVLKMRANALLAKANEIERRSQ